MITSSTPSILSKAIKLPPYSWIWAWAEERR
nr:MAG TPA: SinI restriction endonuclease [Caudoviricetes sp.]